MKAIIVSAISLLMLSGCFSTLPKWPDRPEGVSDDCLALKLLPGNTTKLSDMLDIINENYAEYRKCKTKVELWNKWYEKQKKIYEEAEDENSNDNE